MSPKNTSALGILLMIGGIYLEFHPLWLVLFAIITLYGFIRDEKEEEIVVEGNLEKQWQSLHGGDGTAGRDGANPQPPASPYG